MSAPFYRKKFTFTQPDGTKLDVIGSGNQRDAVFETPDGFTVVEDPATGFYEYASPTADGGDIEPSGITAAMAKPPTVAALQKGVRPNRPTARARGREGQGLPAGGTRWEARRRDAQLQRLTAAAGLAPAGIALAPPKRTTTGTYVGLCLLIDFDDEPATISQAEVEEFCNKPGYSGYGNNGSVRDYFHEVSNEKLTYTNMVTPYYRAKHPRDYYTKESVAQPLRARELIREALTHWVSKGFDFSKITVDPQEFAYAVNVFYAGPVVNNWAKGLWPHAYYLATPFKLAAGKFAHDYQITNIGDELGLGTFCHENGHMICDFPDLYDYGYESSGVGVYCLMCAGNSDEKNPAHVGAYLKNAAGWSTPRALSAQNEANAQGNEVFIHRKNSTEYFLIENRVKAGRDSLLPGSGLAIWHVDELGSNNDEQMTSGNHYECALVQADGLNELENGTNTGDPKDLFSTTTTSSFTGATWWDQSAAGLSISGIGASGPTVKFKSP